MKKFYLSLKPYIIKEMPDIYFIYKPEGYTSDHSFQIINNKKSKSVISYIRDELDVADDLKNPTYKYGQINRLDFGTNGTIIVAKNIKTYEDIQKKMQDKKIKKVYFALLDGKIEKKHDYITLYMRKIFENGRYTVDYDTKNGEPTLSEYMLWKYLYDEKEKKYYSLIMVRIYTGMTHQIRIHMKSINHSLINDINYGNTDRTINNGNMFLISYVYCIKGYGCSVDYRKEPDFMFPNLTEKYKEDYLGNMKYLIKKNDERKEILKKFRKIVHKQNKELTYYVSQKEIYTIVNIPSGKLSEALNLEKITCLIDNRLHIVALIDTDIKFDYIYYFLVRNTIKPLENSYFDIIPHKYIELKIKSKTFYFSQIFVKLKQKFISFTELTKKLNENNIIFIYDKEHGKNEVEFTVFKHFHNYVLPIVNNKIIKKKWIDNFEKNKYKYDMNCKFTNVK